MTFKLPIFETFEECRQWCYLQAVPHRRLGYTVCLHWDVPLELNQLWHEDNEDVVVQLIWRYQNSQAKDTV
jgi:hypothetical protein